MSISLSVHRKSYADFDQLNKIINWCVDLHGASAPETWTVGFSEESDEYATFIFYDEQLATLTKLQFPNMLTPDEFEEALWGYNLPMS